MTQSDMFPTYDLDLALCARDAGIAQAAQGCESFLEAARAVARILIAEQGYATADDVRRVWKPEFPQPRHYNAWGAVFKHPSFVACGRRRSAAVQGHGNWQTVWRRA